MVQLQRLSILAKPSPAEDFRLLINLGSSAPLIRWWPRPLIGFKLI